MCSVHCKCPLFPPHSCFQEVSEVADQNDSWISNFFCLFDFCFCFFFKHKEKESKNSRSNQAALWLSSKKEYGIKNYVMMEEKLVYLFSSYPLLTITFSLPFLPHWSAHSSKVQECSFEGKTIACGLPYSWNFRLVSSLKCRRKCGWILKTVLVQLLWTVP